MVSIFLPEKSKKMHKLQIPAHLTTHSAKS